jgi:O-antigen/teichoic acid export membrane protein
MPLIQSGISLIASSIVTSGLGFIFWIVAARQFTSAQLGIGSAVITAMILLTEFAQLGLKTGLVKFLPTAGTGTRGLIARSYGIAIAVAFGGAIIFLAGIPLWSPALADLRASPALSALFVLGTMFWVLFLLEDSVLVGLRMAPWVPVENGMFGLFKIVLLFPLAAASGDFGVFVAWVVPVFVVVFAVNVLIARRLDRTDTDAGPTNDKPSTAMRDVVRYSLVDWAATASRMVVIGVLPLIVLAQLGSSQSAYYFLAWTIAFSVYLLSANVGDALVAEASYDEDNVDRHTLHSGLLSMAISIPIVLAAAVLAPIVLRAFGTEYADEATTVLRLLLVGALPNVVTRTFIGKLRAERRMRAVFVYEFLLSLGVLVLGWLLLPPLGIVGLGVAWLVVLSIAAIYAIAAESVWWWAPRLEAGRLVELERRVEPVRRLTWRLPSHRLDPDVRRSLRDRYTSRPRWRRVGLTPDLQTIAVAGCDGRPPLTIELARTSWGNEMLARRSTIVAELADVDGIASLRPLLPYPIDHDVTGERHFMIESAISGRRGTVAVAEDHDEVVDEATGALAVLYEATGGWVTFDQKRLQRFVSLPLRQLGDTVSLPSDDLAAVEQMLCDAFDGIAVPSARQHGNLVLENLLFDRSGKLAGLINWEWSDVGPVFLDRSAIALSATLVRSGTDVGPLVVELLDEPDRLLSHRALGGTSLPSVDPKLLVLLAWLHRLRPTLGASGTRAPTQLWVARNVTPVIKHPIMSAAAPAPTSVSTSSTS